MTVWSVLFISSYRKSLRQSYMELIKMSNIQFCHCEWVSHKCKYKTAPGTDIVLTIICHSNIILCLKINLSGHFIYDLTFTFSKEQAYVRIIDVGCIVAYICIAMIRNVFHTVHFKYTCIQERNNAIEY